MQESKGQLIAAIKAKKELGGIADSIVADSLVQYLVKNRLVLETLSSKDKKQVMKAVRAELRKQSGRFQTDNTGRRKLLERKEYAKLLATHTSTSERLPYYQKVKDFLQQFSISSILDLGCGLNPIGFATQGIKYYAVDIREDELSLVASFFQQEKINGKTLVHDLRKTTDLPAVDLCLLLKVLDIIEKRGHKLAEKIITSIHANYFLISFSTKTLSGKPMNHPQRGWIERMLHRRGYAFTPLIFDNEIFYFISKEKPLPQSISKMQKS